jgi:outer membrane protein OmpA-like peptidoglycan-associated protein
MPHDQSTPRPVWFGRTLVQALAISLIPLGTAYAQAPVVGVHVRVSSEETKITEWSHERGLVLMRAVEGNLLEVIDVDGDRYVHRKSNWYHVVLPADPWGTRRTGWISGDHVDQFIVDPPSKSAAPMAPAVSDVARPEPVKAEPAKPAPPPVPVSSAASKETDKPEVCEVVLNFEFNKSNLTEDAKTRLNGAVATLKANPQGVMFALEGHADSTGSEKYNEKLGLARAETVKRYLAEQHNVPLSKISVTSYGEKAPVASNATKDGRAQNRRVVVKVGA